jgi:phospho-N-acetylmuramoyl-pentapeptide-transferase
LSPWIRDSLLFVAVLVLTLVLAPALIRMLRALRYKQTAYEDAPQAHALKSGTPTMGGLLFVLALFASLAVARDAQAVALVVLGVLCAAIGFADDYLGVRRGRNRGLRARAKFVLTALAGAVFLALVMHDSAFAFRDVVLAVGGARFVAPDWVWYALSLVLIVATTHAVNLTDGLDGLAAGTTLPPLLLLAWFASRAGAYGVAAVDTALAAACLGFLAFNRHPAKVFMGDTGSLVLGGVIAGSVILVGNHLLLPLLGGVFVAEAVSVILQVAYYKATKRRIFRMSPLHHHFELGGWTENKVTGRFVAASVVLALAAWAVGR